MSCVEDGCINIFYYKNSVNNFGDSVNEVFFDLLAKKKFKYINNEIINKDHYIVTGSILHFCNEHSIVIGSGLIKNNHIFRKPLKIYSVRGPKTRENLLKMDIECPENYGDPLILFPCVYTNHIIEQKKNKIGIIPHYIDINTSTLNNCYNNLRNKHYDVEIIDIRVGINYKKLIDNILSCEIIISSSLHGIIMGMIYKKKTVYTEFSSNVIGNKFKFYDFFESLDIDYKFLKYDSKKLEENIINFEKDKILKIGLNIINTIPFIDNDRKIELINIWNNYWCKYM